MARSGPGGYDGLGQLDTGTSDEQPHPVPVQVAHLSGVVAIAAGGYHSLAVRADGTVWAWGDNRYGELGVTTTTTCGAYHFACSPVPVRVASLSGVRAVAVGGWGNNADGQLANGTTTPPLGGVPTPTKSKLSHVSAIAAGYAHTVALTSDGSVWAAGLNSVGQLGNGTVTDSCNPVLVSGLRVVVSIGAGQEHSLAVVAAP